MLYLVKPDRTTEWSDLPADIVIDHARRGEINLNSIPWEPAERSVDDTTLRLALRNGVPCDRGIVVNAVDVANHDRAERLAAGLVNLQESGRALEAHDQVMEQLMPGWTDSGKKLDAEISESTRESIQEAENSLARRLEQKVDLSLAEHWLSLGGYVPDPL